MWKSIVYVVKENLTNLYRIYSISKYELLADMRDSKFGIFWNFASPAIQVFTYWLVFGVAWGRSAQTYRGVTVPYLPWVYSTLYYRWLFSCLCENQCHHQNEISCIGITCNGLFKRIV